MIAPELKNDSRSLPEVVAFLENPLKMHINGEEVEAQSQGIFETKNPATGKILAHLPSAQEVDVNEAVSSARNAFENIWKDTKPSKKAKLIWRLADLMERDKQIFMQLETLDNGKPLNKAEYDVLGAINHFRYYSGWATKIEGSTIPVGTDKMAFTQREALGVVGLIVPWNFPLMMAAWKLAPALACGNTCVLKPAEQTSLTALYLGKLVKEAGFPDGVVNVVTGFGAVTGEAISRHQGIDKVSFTGSTAVGRKITEASAQSNLKRLSLELGGKSPNVIFEDADLDKVLAGVHWSSFYNTGQECTLGSRLFIQKSVYQQVIDKLAENAQKLTIGEGLDSPDLGPMISEGQMNTVLRFIESGKAQNADLEIVREEIFGPVVTVTSFDTFDEAVQRANDTPYGLASAVWTQNISKAHQFANALDAGTVWINTYDLFDPAVPFGGFKESGFGKEMDKSAIELYTREKTVWIGF